MGSTLYTCVDQEGRKDVIVLNANYSRRELAEKLKGKDTSYRICKILDEGRQLQKNLRIRCRDEGIITTDEVGSLYYFYKGDTVTVYPDCTFYVKPSIFRRLGLRR